MENPLFQRLIDPDPCRFVPHWRERCRNIQINWHSADTVPFAPRSRFMGLNGEFAYAREGARHAPA